MKLNTNILAKIMFSLAVVMGVFAVSTATTFAQEKGEKMEKREKGEKGESEERDEKLAKQAKISMAQAREIALRAAPGTVEDGELEREKGKLVYSFDIRNAKGTISEVWVDAKTGKVVKVEEEDAAAEAKEKREDKAKKPE